jgi:hypothetical protein
VKLSYQHPGSVLIIIDDVQSTWFARIMSQFDRRLQILGQHHAFTSHHTMPVTSVILLRYMCVDPIDTDRLAVEGMRRVHQTWMQILVPITMIHRQPVGLPKRHNAAQRINHPTNRPTTSLKPPGSGGCTSRKLRGVRCGCSEWGAE